MFVANLDTKHIKEKEKEKGIVSIVLNVFAFVPQVSIFETVHS
jgi:hypothetical protein